MDKSKRQKHIIEIIKNKPIETQQELSIELEKLGINSTQATISRDIKDLRILKVQTGKGSFRYTTMDKVNYSLDSRIKKIFKLGVLTIDLSEAGIVVKTIDKLAGLCSDYIESLNLAGVVGMVYSNNTVLITLENRDCADKLCQKLRSEVND